MQKINLAHSVKIIALLAICLCQTVSAYTIGYQTIGDAWQTQYDNRIEYIDYYMLVPVDYIVHLNSIWIYATNVSGGVTVQGGLYNSDGDLLIVGSVETVNGQAWYESEIDEDIMLVSGTYYLATLFKTGTRYSYNDATGMGTQYQVSSSLPGVASFTDEQDRAITFYLDYDVEIMTSDVVGTQTIYTGGLIAVLVICLALFKFGFPILNLVFGIIALGLVAATIGNTYVLFSPYLQLGVALVSVMLMLFSVNRGLRS